MKKRYCGVVGLLALMAAEGGVVRTPLVGVGTAESWKYRNGDKQLISSDGTAAKFDYDTVQVRAYETAAGVDSGNYLTLYYGNGNEAGTSVGAGVARMGLPFYASLASAMGPSFSYVVELFNDGAKVGQSESLFFTDAMAENYVAFATSTGNLPAMATWMAGGFSAAPEPNSAVLLLLGCAALALRRKKAEELA